jgi:hypothetical protein
MSYWKGYMKRYTTLGDMIFLGWIKLHVSLPAGHEMYITCIIHVPSEIETTIIEISG